MAFANAADLQIMLNRTFTTGQIKQAEALLDQATSAIQSEVSQTITLVEDDVAVLRGSWSGKLILPERPVVEITDLDIDGTEMVEGTGFTWDGHQTLYRGRWTTADGVWESVASGPYNADLHWGGPQAQVTVTYSHGFTDVPEVIKGVCLAMVARTLPNPGGAVTSETLGPYSVTYGTSTLAGSCALNPAERRIVRKAVGR